ncbi:hypothetical protein F4553_005613 [Allocatelliglobosispora scoriae]|uniref:Peptidase C39-like domain-containing protein n=1 Tax=Allocatelliglobosispora scoriae TaxID=643052 RepID=A0A841BYI7_9ACTN|nr:papain-like cysteine protease family protein [Allocatelliglobosispora scoriae]MBB5872179.1 hypothetical protein [Allocatelliglobosispora scoriae]
MSNHTPGPARRSRAITVIAVMLAALTLPGAPALAGSPGPHSSPAAVPIAAPAAAVAATWRKLNITMQAQQLSNWCWAASGNTVAAFYGYSYSQNQFCNLAFNRSMNSSCPNNQATLGNDQTAFAAIGIDPGYYYNGYLSYNTVVNEIEALRPIITRIQWQSGGGHMMVIYGYDKSQSWVYWGNPWASSSRYNWGTWSYYVNNSSFFWTHSLYQIGA